MAKADRNSVYVLNGNYFSIKSGDELPDGATITEEIDDSPEAEERAQERAPENKAKQPVPENRAAKQGA